MRDPNLYSRISQGQTSFFPQSAEVRTERTWNRMVVVAERVPAPSTKQANRLFLSLRGKVIPVGVVCLEHAHRH